MACAPSQEELGAAGEAALTRRLAELSVRATVHSARCVLPAGRVVVKSLLFCGPSDACLLVIVPLETRVDLTRLSALLGCRRNDVRLASPERVLAATGFPVGAVPPVGHLHGPLRTVVDGSLLCVATDASLFGGGGSQDASLELTVYELLRALPEAQFAHVLRASAEAALDERVPATQPLSVGGGTVATALCAVDAVRNLVTLDATVTRVRRMGRLLLFATVTTPVPQPLPALLLLENGSPAMLQAIVGKTFAATIGDPGAAARTLRSVRPGTRWRLTGRPQASSREGRVDIVVSRLDFLEGGVLPDGEEAADREGPLDDDEVGAIAWVEDDEEGSVGFRLQEDEEGDGESDEDELEEQLPDLTRGGSGRAPRRSSRRALPTASSMQPLPLFTLPAGVSAFPVTTAAEVEAMRAAVLDFSSAAHGPLCATQPCVALDAEWRPYAFGAAPTPVALLQVSTRRAVFLVDTLALARVHDGSAAHMGGCDATEGLTALNAFFHAIMPAAGLLKLGFGLRHDLARLVASFPGALTFASPSAPRPAALLDLRDAAAVAAHDVAPSSADGRRMGATSLKSLARLVLRVHLDKQQQMSDWGARPLTDAQREYAAADAAILCTLFDSLVSQSPRLRARLPYLLDSPSSAAALLVERTRPKQPQQRPSAPRGDKVPLSSLSIDVDALLERYLGLPLPGKGRDAALLSVTSDGERARGAGGARGGIVAAQNAALLFMNAEPVAGKRYPNTFWRRPEDNALMMSWFAAPGQTAQSPEVQSMLKGERAMLLFARLPRGAYIFLGRLACDGVPGVDAGGLLMLHMQLLDSAALNGSLDVAGLLMHAQGEAGAALVRAP